MIVLYFGALSQMGPLRVLVILLFSVVGILGSYSVAWFGIRVNTYANSRTAFASLAGNAFPVSEIPLRADVGGGITLVLAAVFFAIALAFAHRSFYGMRIGSPEVAAALAETMIEGRPTR